MIIVKRGWGRQLTLSKVVIIMFSTPLTQLIVDRIAGVYFNLMDHV